MKVEEIGDSWRGKTFPRIRLKGNWLRELGITENSKVAVTVVSHGVLQIAVIKEKETDYEV